MTELGGSSAGHDVPLPGGGRVRLAWGAATDIGRRRAINEDSFVAVAPVFAVADGMGGHSAGDIASGAVVGRLAEAAETNSVFTVTEIERALELATDDIERLAGSTEYGVGTTVTGAALALANDEPWFLVFNVGDSRVYTLDGNELHRVTVDHSVVQELVDAGFLHEDDAATHPDSNVITRAVGFNVRAEPDYARVHVRAGLRLLVCSDGLTREVGDAGIRMHLAAKLDPGETAAALIDAALAGGGRDNITAIVVDVLDAPQVEPGEGTAPRSPRH